MLGERAKLAALNRTAYHGDGTIVLICQRFRRSEVTVDRLVSRSNSIKGKVIHMGFVLGVIAGACMGFIVTALITANR